MILEAFLGLKIQMIHNTGVYRFKKGFNGDFVEFIDEMYMVFNPFINTLFNIIEAIYIKFLILKDKLKEKKK